MSIASDGRLLFEEIEGGVVFDIRTLPLEGERVSTALLADPSFREEQAAVSPDSRWVAYVSDESGRPEVYVRPFPDVEAGKWQVSSTGGRLPRWAPDGRTLFFLGAGALQAAAVETASTFTAGTLERLFSFEDLPGVIDNVYDISGDGTRFLFMKEAVASGDDAPPQLDVVTHWFEELRRLVPVP